MGYVGRGLDLLYRTSDSGYVEACRFAKDMMHGLAAAAFVGACTAEVTIDEPKRTVITVGLLATSALLELGAWANKWNIENELRYSAEGTGS